MENNNKLEQYLFHLEKQLMDLSPSDRSKIILETSEHIQHSLEKYSDKTLSQILEDLGPPERVANHYRLDKELKTFRPQKHPVLKWLSITFLGTTGLFFVFVLILVWKFTPVFKIDEKNQRVIVLGGLIDINATSGKIKIMDDYHFVDGQFGNHFDGSFDFPKEEYEELVINFKSGVLNLSTSADSKLGWNCKLEVPPSDDFLDRSKEIVVMSLEKYEGINCNVTIPADVKLTVDGSDAQITVQDAEFDTFIEINNGQVFFNYNPEVDYVYDIKVDNGHVSGDFQSSQSKNAYEVRVYIKNGSIQK